MPRKATAAADAAASADVTTLGAIPEHMRKLEGSYAPTWKPETEGDAVHLIVTKGVHSVEVESGRGKGKRIEQRRIFEGHTVGDEDERFGVWESATLSNLFDELNASDREGVGREVFVRYDGVGKAKPGQNPPKLFTCAIAED